MSEIEKASRGGVAGMPVSPYNVTISSYSDPNAGIERGTGADWFGPLNPIQPSAPKEVASRQFDFMPGVNLQTRPRQYSPISFRDLRDLADGYDVLRLVIETRKDQIARMDWSIKPVDPKAKQSPQLLAQIAQVEKFFQKPDGLHNFADWTRLLAEDLFVIDAPTLYKQRDRSGNLLALQPLDGATIKPVIDDWGRTPQPYSIGNQTLWPVAYQQELKGFPAVDYTTHDLIYRPRNMRVNKIYGYSPVEQIIITVNIALRRELFLLNYYTEGNVPDSLIGVPENWTPDQISTFQKYWDSTFEGNLAARRKAKFVPGGVAKTFIQTKEPDLNGPFDEWLARVICFAFSVTPQAFVKMVNRATAETQKDTAEEEGLTPILDWFKSVFDSVIHDEFGLDMLEFAWGEDEQVDEQVQEAILTSYASKGIMTINEARAKLGLDPFDNPAANEPMVVTATGWMPIESNTIAGKQANIDAFGPPQLPPPAGLQGQGDDHQTGDAPRENGDAKPGENANEEEVGKSAWATFRKGAKGSLSRSNHVSAAGDATRGCQCQNCLGKGLRYSGQGGGRGHKGYAVEARQGG